MQNEITWHHMGARKSLPNTKNGCRNIHRLTLLSSHGCDCEQLFCHTLRSQLCQMWRAPRAQRQLERGASSLISQLASRTQSNQRTQSGSLYMTSLTLQSRRMATSHADRDHPDSQKPYILWALLNNSDKMKSTICYKYTCGVLKI